MTTAESLPCCCTSELFVDYFHAADSDMSGRVSKETMADAFTSPNIGPGIPLDMAIGLADRVIPTLFTHLLNAASLYTLRSFGQNCI